MDYYKRKAGEDKVNKKILIYDDQIGYVEYVQHMGNDLTIVNSARVSYGKEKPVNPASSPLAWSQNRRSVTVKVN